MGKAKQTKIAIYSPYLSMLGGGEKYLFDIAQKLSENHKVFIFAHPSLRSDISKQFGMKLERVCFLPEALILTKNILEKYIYLSNYDVIIFMTDGSLPFPVAKRNLLIVQSPVHIPKLSPINKLKLLRWKIICYSEFMQQIIQERLQKNAEILSPTVVVDRFAANRKKKKNIILSVGRFFQYPHNKRHDVLIDVFKKNYQKYFSGWRLVIVGGLTERGGKKIFDDLKKEVGTYPIKLLANVSFDEILVLYKQAKIYWHAAGFGENIDKFPERAEHFGMTTLEAMAAGEIPLVFAGGGQKDIISEGENGFLWTTEEELVEKTYKLVKNRYLMDSISEKAALFIERYSKQKFHERLERIIT